MKGSIPGHKGNTVIIRDAHRKRMDKEELKLPKYYPTFTHSHLEKEGSKNEDMFMAFEALDPFAGANDGIEG